MKDLLMAKGLPYFKFFPTEWLTGDIVFETFEVQGLFINICAIYWQRDGDLSLDDIEKRFKKPTALNSLIDTFIFVDNGKISISFLDEQLTERGHISQRNSKNGSKGGRPKGAKTKKKKPTAKRELSDNNQLETGLKPIRTKEELQLEENISIFELFRKDFKGTKRGLEVEFENFQKHKDWELKINLLLPAREKEEAHKKEQLEKTGFAPHWKNLSTWINQRCWEQEFTPIVQTKFNNKTPQTSVVSDFFKPENNEHLGQ